jgi:hypothetical protein
MPVAGTVHVRICRESPGRSEDPSKPPGGQNDVMAKIRDIVFDARHPAPIARFWAAALDDYEVAPYDDAELDRLRGLGISDPEDDPTVLVEASHGGVLRLWFQCV